jgi:hypothetical protein
MQLPSKSGRDVKLRIFVKMISINNLCEAFVSLFYSSNKKNMMKQAETIRKVILVQDTS